jgi:DNA invertase Pin-like site-specific DNA recombinase
MSKVGTWGRKSNLTPQVKKKVIELRKQGFGFNKIARELKVGNGTIINFLKEVA